MRDIHAEITATILEQLEAAKPGDFCLPWHCPTGGGMPSNTLTRRAYRGGNSLFLMIIGYRRRYTTSQWATYKQWQELGAQVRRGQKSVPITVPIVISGDDPDDAVLHDDGSDAKSTRFVRYKAGYVFNRDQVEGYTDPAEGALPQADSISSIDKAEALVAASGADIRIGGHQAFYSPSEDSITMPDRARFFDTDTRSATEGWYSTLLHELVHWTGAKPRLARKRFMPNQGDSKQDYAFEELIAEFGSAFLSAHTGVSATLREDHTHYIADWITVLKSDSKAFFRAASAAEKAADYLLAKFGTEHREAA
jgi:antirestriction protein ArdC